MVFIKKHLSNFQVPYLIVSIIAMVFGLTLGFSVLMPFWIALMIAYLQKEPIDYLSSQFSFSYQNSVIIVFCLTMGALSLGIVAFIPFVYNELDHFLNEFPNMIIKAAEIIKIHSGVDLDWDQKMREIFIVQSENILNQTISLFMHYLPSAMSFSIYLVTIPVLVFFFNYDKELFVKKIRSLYPKQAPDLEIIAHEIEDQIRYYILGKIVNTTIIGLVSFILFGIFSLHYALSLAILMGFAVFIPFLGTALATLPLILISYTQFGLTGPFFCILGGHGLIHLWNENLLVPIIFSKSNDMHPLTILSSILVFSYLMGILGVFLAIPLAAILKICVLRWPSEQTQSTYGNY